MIEKFTYTELISAVYLFYDNVKLTPATHLIQYPYTNPKVYDFSYKNFIVSQ